MKLLVGLGNPGKQYDNTRHNAGFLALNNYAQERGLGEWSLKAKFKSEIIETTDTNDEKLVLAKPQTYMNLSGEAVQALKVFYKLENDQITVVHDELDLPSGEVRLKTGGRSAGHNGVESIASHIGRDFHRVRIGIRTELADQIDATDFVLGRLNDDEIASLSEVLCEPWK